jgi:hypothetical protein
MIHFDFIVDDVDAENILLAVRSSALKSLELAAKEMCKDSPSESIIEAYNRDYEYMLSLIAKMTNNRVQDENGHK